MKIGLMLGTGEHDAPGRAPTWQELRAMAVAADEAGLDSVWVADHFFHRGGDGRVIGIHEPWTLLSAIAASTSRVEIGPMVLAVPFRNPGLTAKMAATLDEVSGGRLILGLGCGWHQPEFDAFGYPFEHRVAAFEEALQIITPLLREGRVAFRGRHHMADAELRPRGPRPDGPPILIAGKQPRMLRLVARYADAWNAAWYTAPETATELDQRLANLRAAMNAEGRDPSTLEITVGLVVAFPSLLEPGGSFGEQALSGKPEEVGVAMARYAERGVRHLICHALPRTAEGVRELGRAADAARRALPASLVG